MVGAAGAADVIDAAGNAGTDAGVTVVAFFLRLLMMHLLFVEGHGELSHGLSHGELLHNDAAERGQRLFSLGLRQPTPQLIETYGPATN